MDLDKLETSLLVLFIPSHDRDAEPFWQEPWVDEAMQVLGTTFGGATAYPRGRGVWRDNARDGRLVFDHPVVIHCYTTPQSVEEQQPRIVEFLNRMGVETKQGAVGFVIDNEYYEIPFPLEG